MDDSKPQAAQTPDAVQSPPPDSPPSAWRDMVSIFGVLVSALLLAFVLITFVFQSYQVDGPSMEPTLNTGDHLIVWKVPQTIAGVTGNDYIPNRGDVIIFDVPASAANPTELQLVKRVIALPGERIAIRNGTVTVYNQAHPQGFQPDRTLPYGTVITTTPGNIDVVVGDNQVFVLGDHRDNSKDSRDLGPVRSDDIVGKLIARVLPANNFKIF